MYNPNDFIVKPRHVEAPAQKGKASEKIWTLTPCAENKFSHTAIVRVIPDIHGGNNLVIGANGIRPMSVDSWKYFIQVDGKTMAFSSAASKLKPNWVDRKKNRERCFVNDVWLKMMYGGNAAMQKIASEVLPLTRERYTLVQVIRDSFRPETVGKIFAFKQRLPFTSLVDVDEENNEYQTIDENYPNAYALEHTRLIKLAVALDKSMDVRKASWKAGFDLTSDGFGFALPVDGQFEIDPKTNLPIQVYRTKENGRWSYKPEDLESILNYIQDGPKLTDYGYQQESPERTEVMKAYIRRNVPDKSCWLSIIGEGPTDTQEASERAKYEKETQQAEPVAHKVHTTEAGQSDLLNELENFF